MGSFFVILNFRRLIFLLSNSNQNIMKNFDWRYNQAHEYQIFSQINMVSCWQHIQKP